MNEKIVCTIVTKNYLAYARTLAISIAEHNPDLKLYVLLADRVDGYFDPAKEPFELIRLEDLPDQDVVQKMCFYYTAFELCNGLRGMLHHYIYQQELARSWLYLDSDILIYSSLDEVFKLLDKNSILLSPHLVDPIKEQNFDAIEVRILVSGVYNSGFLGLRRTDETKKFIEWFRNRLIKYSFQRRGEGELSLLFVDQLWLNFAPSLFRQLALLAHPGANVGYWSLLSHPVYKKDSTYFINDKPVIFIHFTGWNISQPSIASRYLPPEKNTNIWEEIGNDYKNILLECGYEECKKYPYAFESFSNKQKITLEMRYLYYKSIYMSSTNLTAKELNPFDNYEYYNKIKSKYKFDSLLRRIFRIYEYDYIDAKISQTSQEPVVNEILKKLARVYKK